MSDPTRYQGGIDTRDMSIAIEAQNGHVYLSPTTTGSSFAQMVIDLSATETAELMAALSLARNAALTYEEGVWQAFSEEGMVGG